MDRAIALAFLGLSGQDFGPCYTENFTHEQFASKWRGAVACPSEADIEAAYAGAVAVPVVPASVTPFQARRALKVSGLLASVEAAVAAADDDTQMAWEYALSVERNSPFVATLAAALSLSDADLDQLFVLAATFTL
jgi:hypothetical protein